ncbi:MAG: 1-acyl-sn-glycerol-3-phosphate acyltransferase [Lachnospiraceae bacterium]|nr:1-acyl-sn-glycerol-3-phosphate acyltransferase [Lachnospiraceae bacterium]
MRMVLVVLSLSLYFIVTLPAYLVLLAFKKKHPKTVMKIAQAMVAKGFRFVLWSAGAHLTVRGLENIPRDCGMLFVSNHRSYADIPFAYCTIPVPLGFIAKKEIKKVPFLSWWMSLLDCYFLDRSNPRDGLNMILFSIDKIKGGRSIFISPEGTRNQKDEMLPFKEGSVKSAVKTGCPVIPVAFWGTDDLYEKHKPVVKSAKIIVTYGKPIYINELEEEQKKGFSAYIQGVIAEMIKEERALIEAK